MRDDEYQAIATALAGGGSVGFGAGGDNVDGIAPVMLCQRGAAFVAERIDGSTIGVFADLDVALDAIERDVLKDRT